MTYADLVKNRRSQADHSYVLTFCVHKRRPIFLEAVAATQIIEAMHRSERLGYCSSLAWVVMPDHVHWLVTLSDRCSLPRLMAATKREASKRLQEPAGLCLPIWQAGYYEHQIRAEESLRAQARYLMANPLRAGLVSRLADYPHWYAIWAASPHGPMSDAASGEDLVAR